MLRKANKLHLLDEPNAQKAIFQVGVNDVTRIYELNGKAYVEYNDLSLLEFSNTPFYVCYVAVEPEEKPASITVQDGTMYKICELILPFLTSKELEKIVGKDWEKLGEYARVKLIAQKLEQHKLRITTP